MTVQCCLVTMSEQVSMSCLFELHVSCGLGWAFWLSRSLAPPRFLSATCRCLVCAVCLSGFLFNSVSYGVYKGFRRGDIPSPKISVSYSMLPPKLSPITQSPITQSPKYAGIWNPDYNPHFIRLFYSNQGSTVIIKPTETESFRTEQEVRFQG